MTINLDRLLSAVTAHRGAPRLVRELALTNDVVDVVGCAGAWSQPFVKFAWNSRVPWSAIETMNPPILGAVIE